MADSTFDEKALRDLVKEIAGEARAEMQAEAAKLSKSLTEQYGSVQNAKALGVETNVFAANGSDGDGNAQTQAQKAAKKKAFESKTNIGRFVRSLARQQMRGIGGERAVDGVLQEAKARGDAEMVEIVERSLASYQAKTLALSDFSAGGALVPEEFSSELIPLLYDETVVMELGAQRIPMPNGNLTMPFADTGISASYVGEVQNIPVAEPSVGQIQLTAKKLAVVVPTSNDLLRTPSASADRFVQNDIVNQFKVRTDLALLRDDGTSGKPKGMREWIRDDLSRTTAQSGAALADKVSDLSGLIQRLQSRNIPEIGAGFCFDKRTEWGIKSTLDGNGNFVFMPSMESGVLMGYPFKSTNAMPTNIGAGSVCGEVIFACWGHFLVGDTEALELTVSPDGAYHNGSAVVSGLSTDVTPIRAIARHDCAARFRGQEGEILHNVTWSA